jgi:hypothetical protein
MPVSAVDLYGEARWRWRWRSLPILSFMKTRSGSNGLPKRSRAQWRRLQEMP